MSRIRFLENEIENNQHLLFNCENVREIWNILGIVMNFEIKWKHIFFFFTGIPSSD